MRKIPTNDILSKVELIVLDCDGVLTDRGLLYDDTGKRLLRFDARDGFGLALFTRHSGKKAAILSGRPTDIAHHRFAELGSTQSKVARVIRRKMSYRFVPS